MRIAATGYAMTKTIAAGIPKRPRNARCRAISPDGGRRADRASAGPITSACSRRPPATSATSVASSGQGVSSTSSLRMFWTVTKPISGRNSPNAMRPAKAASRSARATAGAEAECCASAAMSHLLHVGPAKNALRQEDHGDGKNRKGGDVLVVARNVFGPERLDHADQKPAQHRAWERADAAEHRGGERLHARHKTV